MKNRFKTLTILRLWLKWNFGNVKKLNVKNIPSPKGTFVNFNHFLYDQKMQSFKKEFGEYFTKGCTTKQIFNTKF